MSFNEIMCKRNKFISDIPKPIYVNNKQIVNQAKLYTNNLIRSDYDKINCDLLTSVKDILNGRCIYLPNFIALTNDFSLFNQIMSEININNTITWSKHYKIENPDFSETFNMLVKKISAHFKMEILATRLNYYKDNNSWKPFHHDSHAYSNGKKENFTIGISLGASRKLSFKHVKTNYKFDFPQNNGDVFAFDDVINKDFMHGIPKNNNNNSLMTDRISIIVWGFREKLI
jgi:hypothetical protein